MTIAGRTRLGTIFGASRDRIAPSRRFYAGGGGSVRGYGFQALGPRDPVFDDPIGGRSLTEFALEARVRVGDFGIVPFVDAGNISTSPLPRLRRSAVRRRHRRALPYPLRADPGRCRHAAQSAQRRSAHRRLRLARARPSDDDEAVIRVADAGEPDARRWRWLTGSPSSCSAPRSGWRSPSRPWSPSSTPAPGHRFIVDRIAAMTPTSGLRIRIGRIDGSIWGRTQLQRRAALRSRRAVRRIPEIEMDWRPIDFLWNSLVIHELESDLVILHRLPELDPAERAAAAAARLRCASRPARRAPAQDRRAGDRARADRQPAAARRRSAAAGRCSALDVGGARRRRPDPPAARRRARPRPLRPRRADPGAGEQRGRGDARDAAAGAARPRRRGQLVALARAPPCSTFRGGAPPICGCGMDAGRFRLDGWAAPAPFLSGKLQRLTAPRVQRRAAPACSRTAGSTGGCRLRSPALRRRGARRVRSPPQPLRRACRSPPS